MADLDRRIHAFRPDLADERLQGRVPAERWVSGRPARVVAPTAPLRRRPAPDAPLDTEPLAGAVTRIEGSGNGPVTRIRRLEATRPPV